MQQLRDGNNASYAMLFDIYSPQLLRIIDFRLDRRLATRIDAEDVLQEVFVSGLKRIDYLRAPETKSFFVWIRLITRQTLIDLVRHHLGAQQRSVNREHKNDRNSFQSQDSFSIASILVANTTSPSNAVSKRELMQLVESSLQTLSESDREIIALRHFEELTNKQSAEVLEITEKTASIRYVRALTKLKTALSELKFADGSQVNFVF